MAANLAVLEKPIGIRTEHITAEPTSLRIIQHSSTLSSGGYTISDATSNSTLFTSDRKTQHWDARRSFYDAFGVKLFDFTHERRNGIWSIRLPEKEEDPVAKLFHRSWGEGDGSYVGIRFVDAVTEREISLSTRAKFTATKDEQCASSKDVCIYHDGDLIMQTKMINRYMARLPFKDNEWDVHVAQGVDLSFAAAIAMYFAIDLCEKPVMTKSEAVIMTLLPSGGMMAGGAVVAGGGGGGGGGGDGGGGGGGGGSC